MPRLAAVELPILLRNSGRRAPPETIETICGYTIWEGRTKALIDLRILTSFVPTRRPLWTPPLDRSVTAFPKRGALANENRYFCLIHVLAAITAVGVNQSGRWRS